MDATVRLETGGPGDADAVAALHADSWRRHYRGAYSDSFLDGDILTDRQAVWTARLAEPGGSATVLARADTALVGFVHVVLDQDPRWGSLVDNLHVTHSRHRGGIGSMLLGAAGAAVVERASGQSVYLWVLEQNTAAQGFYRALGGTCAERTRVAPPGGVASRLRGEPYKLRFTWPDVESLTVHNGRSER